MKKSKRKIPKPKPLKEKWTVEPLEGGSSKGPFPPDTSDLQRRIKENPLSVAAEARHKLHEVKAGYRRELYEVLALIVGIGRHYYLDYKAWKPFFNQPYFRTGKQKPKARTHHTDALRHTMNYVFDAKSKQARSRTGKYAAALHPMMIIGVPVHLIAEEIEKAGGIEKLYEAYLEREAHKSKKGRRQAQTEEEYEATTRYCDMSDKQSSKPEDLILDDLEDDAGGLDNETDNSEGGSELEDELDIYNDADFGLEPTVKRGFDPEGRPTIEFEMTLARQTRFFEPGQRRAVVHIKWLEADESGWQRIRVQKVIWKNRRA